MEDGTMIDDMRRAVDRNKLKINKFKIGISLLEQTNATLQNQIEIKSNINSLLEQLTFKKKSEEARSNEYDDRQKNVLKDLERQGSIICSEHAKCMHQIEHVQWHLEHKHSHRSESFKGTPVKHQLSVGHRSIDTMSMVNTSECLIKNLADLRRKIYVAKENLEKEVHQKKLMEKNLAKLRKDISCQKKHFSTKRTKE